MEEKEEYVPPIKPVFYADYSYRKFKKNPLLTELVEKMDRLILFEKQGFLSFHAYEYPEYRKKYEKIKAGELVNFEELVEAVFNFKIQEEGLKYADRQTIIDYWRIKADFLKKLYPYIHLDNDLFNYYLELDINYYEPAIDTLGEKGFIFQNHYHDFFYHRTLMTKITSPTIFSKLAQKIMIDAKPTKNIINMITTMTLQEAISIPTKHLNVIFKYGGKAFFNPVIYYYKKLYEKNKDIIDLDSKARLEEVITHLQFIEKINTTQVDFNNPFTEEMIEFLLEINQQRELLPIVQSNFRKIYKKAIKKALLQRQFVLNKNNYKLIKHYLSLLEVQQIIQNSEKNVGYFNQLLDEYFREAKTDFTNSYGQTRKEIVFAQLMNLYHYWQELSEKPDFVKKSLERIKNALDKLESSNEIKELSLNKRLFLIYFFSNDSFLFHESELNQYDLKKNGFKIKFNNKWVNEVILPDLFKNKWEDDNKTKSFYTFFIRNHLDKIKNHKIKEMFFKYLEKEDIIAWFNTTNSSNYELTEKLFKCLNQFDAKDQTLTDFLKKIDFLNLKELNDVYLSKNIKSFFGLTMKPKEYDDITNIESIIFWFIKDKTFFLKNLDKIVEILVLHKTQCAELPKELSSFLNQHILLLQNDSLIISYFKNCNGQMEYAKIKETNQIERFQQIVLNDPEYFLTVDTIKELFTKEHLEDKDLLFIKEFLDKEKIAVWKICEFGARDFNNFNNHIDKLWTTPEIPLKAIDFLLKKKELINKENLFKRNLLGNY